MVLSPGGEIGTGRATIRSERTCMRGKKQKERECQSQERKSSESEKPDWLLRLESENPIRLLRLATGLTPREIGVRFGVHAATVKNWEERGLPKGEAKRVGIKVIIARIIREKSESVEHMKTLVRKEMEECSSDAQVAGAVESSRRP